MIKNDDKNQKNKDILCDTLKFQKDSRKLILEIMQSFAESTDAIDVNSVDEIKEFLEDLKSSLDLCNKNIEAIEKLIKNIDTANIFNGTTIEDNADVNNNTQHEEAIVLPYTIEASEDTEKIIKENDKESEENKYVENTLVISEKSGLVTLPYQISILEQKLEESNNTYSSIDEIIDKEYTLPISLYKNPFVARFRESYKLMRNKEKSSIRDAFDLGLELMFNSNLHPAIISACKNLDELDIYLDYLDSGETNKFRIFKIIFEIAPTVGKTKQEF